MSTQGYQRLEIFWRHWLKSGFYGDFGPPRTVFQEDFCNLNPNSHVFTTLCMNGSWRVLISFLRPSLYTWSVTFYADYTVLTIGLASNLSGNCLSLSASLYDAYFWLFNAYDRLHKLSWRIPRNIVGIIRGGGIKVVLVLAAFLQPFHD